MIMNSKATSVMAKNKMKNSISMIHKMNSIAMMHKMNTMMKQLKTYTMAVKLREASFKLAKLLLADSMRIETNKLLN